MVNRAWGEKSSQLHNGHARSDFQSKTQARSLNSVFHSSARFVAMLLNFDWLHRQICIMDSCRFGTFGLLDAGQVGGEMTLTLHAAEKGAWWFPPARLNVDMDKHILEHMF